MILTNRGCAQFKATYYGTNNTRYFYIYYGHIQNFGLYDYLEPKGLSKSGLRNSQDFDGQATDT